MTTDVTDQDMSARFETREADASAEARPPAATVPSAPLP
jgi:hypothetical protein